MTTIKMVASIYSFSVRTIEAEYAQALCHNSSEEKCKCSDRFLNRQGCVTGEVRRKRREFRLNGPMSGMLIRINENI